MEHDLVKKTKANLFEKAFKKIQEKNNQFNQTIDNTQRSNSPLQNVSIGSSDTNRPPFEFDVDIKDDGSGTFQGDFSQQINPCAGISEIDKISKCWRSADLENTAICRNSMS